MLYALHKSIQLSSLPSLQTRNFTHHLGACDSCDWNLILMWSKDKNKRYCFLSAVRFQKQMSDAVGDANVFCFDFKGPNLEVLYSVIYHRVTSKMKCHHTPIKNIRGPFVVLLVRVFSFPQIFDFLTSTWNIKHMVNISTRARPFARFLTAPKENKLSCMCLKQCKAKFS